LNIAKYKNNISRIRYTRTRREKLKMTPSNIAPVEVPFEALVKELGAKRAIDFISEIKECCGDSVVELKNATETLTIEQIEAKVKDMKKEKPENEHSQNPILTILILPYT
jgi:hypothetical protein